MRRMVASGLIVQAADDTYYLDVEAYQRSRQDKRRLAMTIMAILAVVVAVMILFKIV